MAKSSRASTKKTNRTALRAKVFGPVEDARTSRLADKLMEIATKATKDDVQMDNAESANAATASEPRPKSKVDDSMEVETQERPNRIIKSTERRDRREKRRTLRKNRSSTTFKAKTNRSSKR